MKFTKKTKRIIGIVAIALVAFAALMLLAHVSSGFDTLNPTEWELRQVNEDNLYQTMTFADTDGKLANGADGVTVKLADNNVLKVSGVNGTTEAMDIQIGSIALKANTGYLFDSSLNKGSNQTAYMVLKDASGNILATSYTGPVVIAAENLAADTTATLHLIIAADKECPSSTLKPVICVGTDTDDIVSFYK